MIRQFKYKDITWIDVESPTPAEIEALAKDHKIHSVAAAELAHPSHRSHLDLYENFIYLVLHFPACQICYGKGQEGSDVEEVDFIIGKQTLITVHYQPVGALQEFATIFETDIASGHTKNKISGGWLFLHIIRTLYGSLEVGLEFINTSLKKTEQQIFAGEEKAMVKTLSSINRNLIDFRWALKAHKEILESLETIGPEFFGETIGYSLRAVTAEYGKIWTMLRTNRETFIDLQATNDSLLYTKSTEVMKDLTVVAFILLPLTLIASIFNMHLVSLPIVGQPHDFAIILGLMIVTTLITFWWARHKKWL